MEISNLGNIYTKVGQDMQRIRPETMSQGDIAQVLKVDGDYISSIENGQKTTPLATIQNSADAPALRSVNF